MVRIVVAKEKDLAPLKELWDRQYIFHYCMQPRYYELSSKNRESWRLYINKQFHDERKTFLVAYEQEDAIGFILFSKNIVHEYEGIQATRFAEVEDIFVLEEKRNMGIGKMLLREAENHLRDDSIQYVKIQCSSENSLAMGFYRHSGYSDMQVLFYKEL